MGKKIITVDLSSPPKVEQQEEPQEEALPEQKDDYAEVKEEADVIETPQEQPKPKRKPPTKKAIIDPVPEPSVISESDVEAVIETKTETVVETKEQQKVKCQHCNKEMSMKSLKYSHSRNCLGLKKTIEKVSNEKVSNKSGDVKQRAVSTPPPVLESPILPVRMKSQVEEKQEHPRVARMKALKNIYNSLVQNAF
jgi:hypothetical protein